MNCVIELGIEQVLFAEASSLNNNYSFSRYLKFCLKDRSDLNGKCVKLVKRKLSYTKKCTELLQKLN